MQEVISRPLSGIIRELDASAPSPDKTGESLVMVSRLTFALVVIGGGLQAYANSSAAVIPVALTFLVAGYLAVTLGFPGKRPELRVFMLTYGISILVGGLAQCYSVYAFQDPANFSDSVYFFAQLSPKPPFRQWAELPSDTVLALATWQQLYRAAWYLGFSFGPYLAVMFNAMVIGLAGSLTVATARPLFGDDSKRLNRVVLLFAFCGLFIAFGSVLLRDSFVVFFNALWLWGIVRWVSRPTPRSFLIAMGVTAISIYAMLNLREEMVMLFGVYILLAVLAWYCAKKLNISRILAVAFILAAVPVADTYVTGFMQEFRDTQATGQQNYSNLGTVETGGNSLGNRLVVEQPLPIRLVVGAGTLLINPIPLWSNFKEGASDYHIIEGYHGFYLVFVMPLCIAGLIEIVRLLRKQGRKAIPMLFLAAYLGVNLAAVAGSSKLERHLGQFLAAVTIVAALPDQDDKAQRKRVRLLYLGWFSGVVLIHVAWGMMR